MKEFSCVRDAHDEGWALARWATEPQEWIYFHMVYVCPKEKIPAESILVNKIEVKAAKIEQVICNQTDAPRCNEWLESLIKHEKYGLNHG